MSIHILWSIECCIYQSRVIFTWKVCAPKNWHWLDYSRCKCQRAFRCDTCCNFTCDANNCDAISQAYGCFWSVCNCSWICFATIVSFELYNSSMSYYCDEYKSSNILLQTLTLSTWTTLGLDMVNDGWIYSLENEKGICSRLFKSDTKLEFTSGF